MTDRDELLKMSNEELMQRCRFERFRGSGPGGQNRNKLETGVRLVLTENEDISAMGTQFRSQEQNKGMALKRLRMEIAKKMRKSMQPWEGTFDISLRNPQYPSFAAKILDFLEAQDYKVSDAAALLHLSTGQLIHLLERDDQLWEFVNYQRQKRGIHGLRK